MFVLVKFALNDFSAVEVAFFQAAIGAVGLLAIVLVEGGRARAALGNYLTPIFALFYGVILLGEQLTIDEVIGLALIIVGAEITFRGDSAKCAGQKAKAHQYRPHPPFH